MRSDFELVCNVPQEFTLEAHPALTPGPGEVCMDGFGLLALQQERNPKSVDCRVNPTKSACLRTLEWRPSPNRRSLWRRITNSKNAEIVSPRQPIAHSGGGQSRMPIRRKKITCSKRRKPAFWRKAINLFRAGRAESVSETAPSRTIGRVIVIAGISIYLAGNAQPW